MRYILCRADIKKGSCRSSLVSIIRKDKAYGYYDKNYKEYIITKQDLPRPWVNYLSNGEYCALVSHIGGMLSFYMDDSLHRILQGGLGKIPKALPSRILYLKDDKTGDCWILNCNSFGQELDNWQCVHGLGYTRIISEYNKILGDIIYFVPIDDTAEIWILRLKNKDQIKRTLSIYPYVEWALGNAFLGENWKVFFELFNLVEYKNGIILATTKQWFIKNDDLHATENNTAWTKQAFMAASYQPDSYDCSKKTFWGSIQTKNEPKAIKLGKCFNSPAG